MFGGVISLIKSYGPSMAGWVLLMTFFAYFAGKGGRLAMKNLQSILEDSEELRRRMKLSLDDCQEVIDRQREQIRELNTVVATSHLTIQQMNREINRLEIKAERLEASLEDSMRKLGQI